MSVIDHQIRTKRISLDGGASRVLGGVLPLLSDYAVSPDGSEFIAGNYATGEVYRYPIGGGTGKPLPRGLSWAQRGTWASDGSFWVSNNAGLDVGIDRVNPNDSLTRPFGTRNSDLAVEQILPGDRIALAIRQPNETATGPGLLLDLRTGDVSPLLDRPLVAIRYAVGHLVYVLGDGSLEAVPFDVRSKRITGAPVSLASGVALTGTGLAQFAVDFNSADGRSLAFTAFRGGVFGVHRIRMGGAEPAESLLTSPQLAYSGIWLKDGSALLTVGQTLLPESNLDIAIVRNGGRGPIEPLVSTRFIERYPALSPDNEWIAFASNQSGRDEVYVRRLAGGEQI